MVAPPSPSPASYCVPRIRAMGFNLDGLPMGSQAIGRPRADLDLLRLAWACEQATSWRT